MSSSKLSIYQLLALQLPVNDQIYISDEKSMRANNPTYRSDTLNSFKRPDREYVKAKERHR